MFQFPNLDGSKAHFVHGFPCFGHCKDQIYNILTGTMQSRGVHLEVSLDAYGWLWEKT
jgi:hypothetical protein